MNQTPPPYRPNDNNSHLPPPPPGVQGWNTPPNQSYTPPPRSSWESDNSRKIAIGLLIAALLGIGILIGRGGGDDSNEAAPTNNELAQEVALEEAWDAQSTSDQEVICLAIDEYGIDWATDILTEEGTFDHDIAQRKLSEWCGSY